MDGIRSVNQGMCTNLAHDKPVFYILTANLLTVFPLRLLSHVRVIAIIVVPLT